MQSASVEFVSNTKTALLYNEFANRVTTSVAELWLLKYPIKALKMGKRCNGNWFSQVGICIIVQCT